MSQVAITSRKPRFRSFFERTLIFTTGLTSSLGPGPVPVAVAVQA